MENGIIEAYTSVVQPVLETAMVMAGHYTKACGRTCVTSIDLSYCLKYCAMNKVGENIGSLFPDIYDSNDSDSDSVEECDEDIPENNFIRYEGDESIYNEINNAVDRWDTWTPTCPAEEMLKSAIDSQE